MQCYQNDVQLKDIQLKHLVEVVDERSGDLTLWGCKQAEESWTLNFRSELLVGIYKPSCHGLSDSHSLMIAVAASPLFFENSEDKLIHKWTRLRHSQGWKMLLYEVHVHSCMQNMGQFLCLVPEINNKYLSYAGMFNHSCCVVTTLKVCEWVNQESREHRLRATAHLKWQQEVLTKDFKPG